MIVGSDCRKSDAPFSAGYNNKLTKYGIAMDIT